MDTNFPISNFSNYWDNFQFKIDDKSPIVLLAIGILFAGAVAAIAYGISRAYTYITDALAADAAATKLNDAKIRALGQGLSGTIQSELDKAKEAEDQKKKETEADAKEVFYENLKIIEVKKVYVSEELLFTQLEDFFGFVEQFHSRKSNYIRVDHQYINMFDFEAKDEKTWNIGITLEHQYVECFDPKQPEEVLSILQLYLEWKFADQFEKISYNVTGESFLVKNGPVLNITWKSKV
jgi:hypothetical protein